MPLEPSLPSSAQEKLEQLRAQIDQALHTLVSDMLSLSAAEREAAVSEARTAAQQEKEAALDTVRHECEAAIAERVAAAVPDVGEGPSLAERLAAAESEVAAARTQVAALTAERDEAVQKLAFASDEAAKTLEEARTETQARVAEARAEAEAQLAEVRAAAAAEASVERAQAAQELADALGEADARLVDAQLAADDRVAQVRAEADAQIAQAKADADGRVAQATAAANADLEQARAGERECELACIERLADAMRALDAASSLSTTLDTLADHVAAHVARVAILVLRNGELRLWTSAGFGEEILQGPSIAVRLDGETVIARAARTGERQTTANGTSEKPLEPLPFAALPPGRIGLAVPLRVGGRTVAVVYADENAGSEPSVPSAWPENVEILSRHAGIRLEVLTLTGAYALHAHQADAAARKARVAVTAGPGASSAAEGDLGQRSQAAEEDASAIRYARLLIAEIKLYHEDAVVEGREHADLLARLAPEIARARRLYEERVPAEVRNRADHFGQELIRTLANGDPRLLGQVT